MTSKGLMMPDIAHHQQYNKIKLSPQPQKP